MSLSGRALALCALAAIALCFAPFYRPRAVGARLAPPLDPAFAFDSRYREFLEAVEKATPQTATVAVIAPETSDLYLFTAAYRLAPRRVVGEELSADAQFLAVYRRGQAPPAPPGATALPGGFLSTP